MARIQAKYWQALHRERHVSRIALHNGSGHLAALKRCAGAMVA
jgi:hypothetical protein